AGAAGCGPPRSAGLLADPAGAGAAALAAEDAGGDLPRVARLAGLDGAAHVEVVVARAGGPAVHHDEVVAGRDVAHRDARVAELDTSLVVAGEVGGGALAGAQRDRGVERGEVGVDGQVRQGAGDHQAVDHVRGVVGERRGAAEPEVVAQAAGAAGHGALGDGQERIAVDAVPLAVVVGAGAARVVRVVGEAVLRVVVVGAVAAGRAHRAVRAVVALVVVLDVRAAGVVREAVLAVAVVVGL